MHTVIEWISYDAIKHMRTADVIYKNSSKSKEESTFLRQGLSCAIRRLSIIWFKILTFHALHRMQISSNIRGVLGLPLAYCCQSLPFSL